MLLLLFVSLSIFNNHNSVCEAIYAEDAGVLDFAVTTAGHGAVGMVHPFQDTIVTTDKSDGSGTSCFVASRKQSNGDLVWRRNVCSVSGSDSKQQAHDMATVSGSDVFFTADHAGVVRAWTMDDASLLWDADVESGSSDDGLVAPKIWALSGGNKNVVAVASQEDLIFLDAETGEVFDKINTLKAVNGNLRKGHSVQWLTVVGNGQSAKALFAYVNAKGEIQSGNDLYFAQLEVGNGRFKSIKSLNKGKHILANSVTLQAIGGEKWHALAVTKSGVLVDVSVDDSNIAEEVAASKLHPSWATVVAVEATSEPSAARIMCKSSPESEVTMALFRFDEAAGQGWERLYGSADAPEIE
ncbi:MAG: hypothetical protein SGILL_001813, partial [Bacillariaceae sp.]